MPLRCPPGALFVLTALTLSCASDPAPAPPSRPPPTRARPVDVDRRDRAPAPPPVPHLRLRADIDPGAHTVRATATWTAPAGVPWPTLYIHRAARITDARIDDAPGQAHLAVDGAPPPYVDVARPLRLSAPPGRTLTLSYTLALGEDPVADVNQIAPDLVELAIYAGWYPFSPAWRALTYDLEVTMPGDATVLTNATPVAATAPGRVAFRTDAPGNDVALVAAPGVHCQTTRSDTLQLRLCDTDRSAPHRRTRQTHFTDALRTFTERYSRAALDATATVVYAPRAGWGYSRFPLIVVSEERAARSHREPFGEARDTRGTVHELAHFWWQVADTSTDDDWLNEALAEYSALRFTVDTFGDGYLAAAWDDFTAACAKAQTGEPVIGTPADSADRYLNWYLKPAFALLAAARQDPNQMVDYALGAVFRFSYEDRAADAKRLFNQLSHHVDDAVTATLSQRLHAPGWDDATLAAVRSDLGLAPGDPPGPR